ncbi:hypothetical protein, partial [Nostoc sp.]
AVASASALVVKSVRRCSSLRLLVPTVLLVRRWGLLENLGSYPPVALLDVRHRRGEDHVSKVNSDAYGGLRLRILVQVGIVPVYCFERSDRLWFGFSSKNFLGATPIAQR